MTFTHTLQRLMRVATTGLIAGFLSEPLSNALAATRTWDGGGDGTSWNLAENWTDDTLPGPDDDVIISGTGVTILVTSSVEIQGLSIASGSTLRVAGQSEGEIVAFVANGNTILDAVSIEVSAGGRLELPQITQMRSGNNIFLAQGAGSVLNLPQLARIVAQSGWSFVIEARTGGVVQLPALTTTVEQVIFQVRDPDSRIELDSLTALVGGGLFAYANGTLVTPNLERVEASRLILEAGSAMDIDKIASLDNVNLEISGLEPQFPALAELNVVSIVVSAGGRLELPQITRMRSGNNIFLAQGAGSVLNLPQLARIVAQSGWSFVIEARTGGVVQLPALTTTVEQVIFQVRDPDSRIELDSLTALVGGGLFAYANGTLVTPNLERVEASRLILEAGSAMDIDKIASLDNVTLEISGLEPQFSALVEIKAVNIVVSAGGRLVLPQITQMQSRANLFRVQGADSLLSLPDLGEVISGGFDWFSVETSGGGIVQLPALSTAGGSAWFTAQGRDSRIELDALTALVGPGSGFQSEDRGVISAPKLESIRQSEVRVRTRSAMVLGSEAEGLSVEQTEFELSGEGSLTTKELLLSTNSSLLAGGTLTGTLKNRGAIRILDIFTPLKVTGDFQQASEGTLELLLSDLSSPTEHIQVEVAGSAVLDGLLVLNRSERFSARSGENYSLVAYNSSSGVFVDFNALNAGNNVQFLPNYGAQQFALDVTAPGPFFGIDFTLTADNHDFEGQDIVVAASTLVVEGVHRFRSLTVLSGAVTCPEYQPANATGGRLNLEIEQDLTIHAKGRIHADRKGFPERSGPGSPPNSNAGAGHGGWGGVSARGDLGGGPYGSMSWPVTVGSGGGAADAFGGGALHLKVGGVSRVEGALSADGGGTIAGGSGGSVLIEANALTGFGAISATGGNSTSAHGNGAGSGGRIAVIVANIQDFDRRNIKADGGKSDVDLCDGEPGTVFFAVNGKESINATELTLDGQTYKGTLVPNSQQYFVLQVPEGKTIQLHLDHGSDAATAELYASFDRPPSLSQSEFSSEEPGKPDQTLIIPESQSGIYYILVRVSSGPLDQREFTLKAETLPFQVSRVEPRTVGTQLATLRVSGAGFDANTQFKLWKEETGLLVEALNTIIQDATKARVTFNLQGVPADEYVLVATNRVGEVRAPDPVHLKPSFVVKGNVVFTSHPGLRRGRPGQSVLLIENTGDTDIERALVTLTSENHPELSFSIPELDISSFQREGDSQMAEFDIIQLAPGEKITIPIVATIGGEYPGSQIPIEYDVRFFTPSSEDLVDAVGIAWINSPRSFDPNIKIGVTGWGEARWVSDRDALPYVVLFENLPTAEAPAAEVFVEDFIDSSLDLTTFRLGDIQIGTNTVDVPVNQASFQGRVDLRAIRGVYVDIEAGLDSITRRAFWRFTSIDPETGVLPESALVGFLPPNEATGAGEGMVQYSIRPLPSVPSGTVITNQASIVFDVNAPILTEVITNTIDSSAPISVLTHISGEPGETNRVTLAAAGEDPAGSGVREILLYVSEDSGPYQLWRALGAEPEVFEGTLGRRYRLYTTAVDQVGNEEPIPDNPTLVLVFTPLLRITYDAAREKLLLTWPGSIEGYSVQTSGTIGGSYLDLSGLVSRVADDWLVEVDVSEVDTYFRLYKSE